MNLIYIQTIITKYKYYLLFILAISYFSWIFWEILWLDLLNSNTFAVDPTADANSASDQKEAAALIKAYNVIIMMASLIINLLTILVWWFLSPDWTMWDIIWIRSMLHKIWVLMSNIMYIIFWIATILIAFMNIFGFADWSSYDIKKALPRLIIWVAMVPATWFIVSAVISVSNVLTAAVIRLPYETIMAVWTKDIIERMNAIKVPSAVYIDLSKWNNKPILSCVGKINISWEMEYDINLDWSDAVAAWAKLPASANQRPCIPLDEFIMWDWAYNILLLYTYMVLNMDDLKEISTYTWEWLTDEEVLTNTVFDIVKKLLLWVLFIIVYAILIFALFIVLFVRAVYLWIYIMISPIFGLLYFLWDKSWAINNSLWNFTLTKFISLAMVPVYVAAALAFGFVFLMITWATKGIDFKKTDTVEHLTILNSFNIEIKSWITPGSKDYTWTTVWLMQTTIGYIIMNLFSVILLWIVVMAAFKADDISKWIVWPLINLWNSVKNLAMKAPTMIPMVPWRWATSLANIWAAWSKVADIIVSNADNKWTEIWWRWWKMAIQPWYLSQLKSITLAAENTVSNWVKILDNVQLAKNFDDMFYKVAANNKFDLREIANNEDWWRDELEKLVRLMWLDVKKFSFKTEEDMLKAFKEIDKNLNKHIFIDNNSTDLNGIKNYSEFNDKIMKEIKANWGIDAWIDTTWTKNNITTNTYSKQSNSTTGTVAIPGVSDISTFRDLSKLTIDIKKGDKYNKYIINLPSNWKAWWDDLPNDSKNDFYDLFIDMGNEEDTFKSTFKDSKDKIDIDSMLKWLKTYKTVSITKWWSSKDYAWLDKDTWDNAVHVSDETQKTLDNLKRQQLASNYSSAVNDDDIPDSDKVNHKNVA